MLNVTCGHGMRKMNCRNAVAALFWLGSTRAKGVSSATRASLRFSNAKSALPIGIFVDLDNIGPLTHSRADAEAFARPLYNFAHKAGTLSTFQAFANTATRTHVSDEERERREDFDQEFLAFGESDLEFAQTGYDENGILRCGVCGGRMKLNKKDRAKGWTMEDKLNKHMRTLHDREQEKRRNILNGKNRAKGGEKRKLNEKERMKFEKYDQAQVGLFRKPATRSKQKPGSSQPKNDLFRVLREQKVKCRTVEDVDSSLERAALKWMKSTQANEKDSHRGCLVVVSEDSDFRKLLAQASSLGFVSVSVTPISTKQTRKLVNVSDLLLTRAPNEDGEFGTLLSTPNTFKGVELLMEMNGQWENIENDDWEEEEHSMSFEASPLDENEFPK